MFWISYAILGAGLGLTLIFCWQLRGEKRNLEQLLKKRTAYLEEVQAELTHQTAQYRSNLKQAQAIAKKANQARQEFLSKVSHELRNPLYTILGYTQLLQRDFPLNSEGRTNIEQIRRSGEHLLSLINDVLEMVQLETNHLTLSESSFNLRRFLETIETTLQPTALAKGLHLIFYLPSEVATTITADEQKLRQILIHLLDNGLKFTTTGGVTLRVDIGDPGWILEEQDSQNSATYSLFFEIEDTGIGIAPERLEQVFEPFFPTETHRHVHQGAGLGLSICQKLVQLMGGKIRISSTLDRGTLVRINIPVKAVNLNTWSGMLSHGQIIGLAPNQPHYRILIVDDRPENRHLLVRILEPLGFQVQEAANGEEAISFWSTWQPHLIFIDTRMPVMDGYEAIQQIKRLKIMGVVPTAEKLGQTIIIALSAGTLEEEQANLLANGCDDILRKPFDIDRVLEKITQHLGVRYIYETAMEEDFLNDDDDISTVSLAEVAVAEKSRTLSHTTEKTAVRQALSVPSVRQLHTKALQRMPQDWIKQINYSACAGDSEQLYRLIEQIPQQHSALIISLKALVEQFNFRKLRELTQTFIDES